MENPLKNFLYAGIGLASSTTSKVQSSVNELVEQGKISDSEAKKIVDDVFENPYPDDEDSDDEDREEVVLERTPRKIKTNTCNCEICSQARVCLLDYYTHECNDPLAQKFKDSITHTCQTHNLVI